MTQKPWITIPVFISSTFVDFTAERDWLVKRVFPALPATAGTVSDLPGRYRFCDGGSFPIKVSKNENASDRLSSCVFPTFHRENLFSSGCSGSDTARWRTSSQSPPIHPFSWVRKMRRVQCHCSGDSSRCSQPGRIRKSRSVLFSKS